MVRYKSNQNFKNELKKNQFNSARIPELRTNAVLRTKIQTILKTNMAFSTNIYQTKVRLKKKIVVYKKDNKFYIENSTAYALKLKNVRAIMIENSHLVELGLETLNRLKNREDIEIEYQEINAERDRGLRKGELGDTLEKLGNGEVEYGIGIHGIDKGSNEERRIRASSICREGLNINNNSKTILSTSISLGINEAFNQINQDIKEYNFGNGTKVNVVIAVPIYIQNQRGEKIFLGFPDKNNITSGQQYEEHCILDRICAKLNRIPSEFILGYYSDESNNRGNFVENLKHYSNITGEEKENFYKEVSLNMDDISKSYNELITSGNIEKLSEMREKMKQLALNSNMVDNAIMLVQKYKQQMDAKDVKEKKVRQVILEEVQKDKVLSDSTKTSKTRRILLNLCAEAKLSDLSNAKEILQEGTRIQEENYKGKEV